MKGTGKRENLKLGPGREGIGPDVHLQKPGSRTAVVSGLRSLQKSAEGRAWAGFAAGDF